ncbi:MAG TPA: LamG-like jellyroll fold domain-containing protein [Planctomycetota bacterium]
MGRPIVYCSDCGRSLREDDFLKNLASNFDNRPYCSTCRKVEAPPPVTPSARPTPPSSARTPKPFAAAPAKSSKPVVAAVLVGAVLFLLILGVTLSGRRPSPAPEPEKVEAPPPPPPPRKEAVDRVAAEKERAERFERYLKDIRAALDDARFDDRREEIRAMIAKAGELAGARQAEVDGLSALFTRRSRETGLRKGLIGHWRLDDLSGTAAADASGSGFTGKVVGKGKWTAARVASGFEASGAGEHIELPDAPVLKTLQGGPHTLALWYQPKELPTGDGPLHALVCKPGHHSGLQYLAQGRFRHELWLAAGKQITLVSDTPSPPGRFYHVACAVDTEAGQAVLYVDGVKVKDATWPKAAMRGNSDRWRIGVAHPKEQKYWGPAKGVLDDVRLYSRSLSAEEIRFLYDSAPR